MTVEWSGLASEVLITLDRSRTVPLRSQLEDQFRQAIRSGRLGDGERVPSSRALAKALGLSRGLVQECYAQLQAEGYLVSRGGSATRVARAATMRTLLRPWASRLAPSADACQVPGRGCARLTDEEMASSPRADQPKAPTKEVRQ